MKKGDLYVVYGERRPAERVFGEVTRVAKDGTWADFRWYTWAVMWTKRQPVPLPESARERAWSQTDLDEQQSDHMAKLREQGAIT